MTTLTVTTDLKQMLNPGTQYKNLISTALNLKVKIVPFSAVTFQEKPRSQILNQLLSC